MVYAVDFVLNVMKELSSSEPLLFQRDGSLYVASTDGFGRVDYGLLKEPSTIQQWRGQSEERQKFLDIAGSTDAIIRWQENEFGGNKPVFQKDEEPYIQAIAFGSDTNTFTLKKVTKAAQQLAELPNDGKVRMVSHGSNYHSHKYGYAADGTDVYVLEARVMDKEKYLGLVRKEEDKLIGLIGDMERASEAYGRLKIPDCVIVTPYLMVSLPRSGRLHLRRDEPDSWTQDTIMGLNYRGTTRGSILEHNTIIACIESPFDVNVVINAKSLQGANEEGLKSSGEELLAKVTEQLSAVTSSMPLAQKFIDRMNATHNNVCAPNIQQRKDFRGMLSALPSSAPF